MVMTLDDILELQKQLQNKLHNKNDLIPYINKLNTLGEKCDVLMYNKNAFDYEFKEVLEALSASNDPSSLWKNWKKNYELTRSKLYSDLSEKQKSELQMEFVDMFCFFLNMMLVLDIDEKTLFEVYTQKHKINLERIKDY